MRKLFYTFILLLFSGFVFSQQLNLPMNNQFQLKYWKQLYDTTNVSHTSMQPYIESLVDYDATYIPTFLTSYNKFERKLTRESLLVLGNDSVELKIDPLFYFDYCFPKKTIENYTRNTRGVWVRGRVGKALSFETSFIENQITVPEYLQDFVKQNEVFPGMGRTKAFKVTGYDYAMSSGYISYSPLKQLNLQFGHGKLFVGNGYRSLLLSDNSFNYPHFKSTFKFGKFQYTWVVASLMNVKNKDTLSLFSEPYLRKKDATFHLLSYKPIKKLEIAFFQGIIYKMGLQKFNWSTLNPIIFSNAISHGFYSNNNLVLGLNANYKLPKNILVYSQIMCNGYNGVVNAISNKTGFQLGAYWQKVLNVNNLNFRFEYNTVRPFSYQKVKVQQAYSHYSQALAHPLNANFREFVFIGDYNIKNFILNVKIVSANTGRDSLNFNAGNNLNNSVYKGISNSNFSDVEMLQGKVEKLIVQDLSLGYIINPINNFTIKAGWFKRYNSNFPTQYFYFSVNAFIFNQYLDF